MAENEEYSSLSELEGDKNRWSLASDLKLLNTFKLTTEEISKKIQNSSSAFDKLNYKTNVCTDKLNNLITDVLILTNSKFIENRVYEEDIKEITTSNRPSPFKNKGDEQLNSDQVVVEKLKRSIVKGISCLARRYEIPPGDLSGGGGVQTFDRNALLGNLYVYKNRFASRPLPYLIGSDDFKKDTFVGLKSVESDSSPVIVLNFGQNDNAYDDDYGEDGDDLNANHQASAASDDREFSSGYNNQPKQQQQRPITILPSNDNMDDEEEDDIFSPSAQKKPSEPLFRPVPAAASTNPIGNLFTAADESDDDDDDIFTQRVLPVRPNTSTTIQPPPFSEITEPKKLDTVTPDQLAPSSTIKSPAPAATVASSLVKEIHKSSLFATRRTKNKDFFDSDNDDDGGGNAEDSNDSDDLFENKPKRPPIGSNANTKTSSNLSAKPTANDLDDSKSDVSSNANFDTMTASSTSVTTLNESEKGGLKTTNGPTENSKEVAKKVNVKSRLDSIFSSDDDDDTDIFSGFSAKKVVSTPVAQPSKAAASAQSSLFKPSSAAALIADTDSDSDGDIFKPKAKVTAISKTPPKTASTNTSSITSQSNSSQPQQPKPQPVSAAAAPAKPKPVVSSIFSDSDDDDDIFASSKPTKTGVKVFPTAEPPKAKAEPVKVDTAPKVPEAAATVPSIDPLQQAQPKTVVTTSAIISSNSSANPVSNQKKEDETTSQTLNDSLDSLFGDLSKPKTADPNDSLADIMRHKAKLNSRRTSTRKRPSLKPGQILSHEVVQDNNATTTAATADSPDDNLKDKLEPEVKTEVSQKVQSSVPEPAQTQLPLELPTPVVVAPTMDPRTLPPNEQPAPSPALPLPPSKLALSSTDESDDDLFAAVGKPKTTNSIPSKAVVTEPVSKASQSLPITSVAAAVQSSQVTSPAAVAPEKPTSSAFLLDSSDDSDNDIFGTSKASAVVTSTPDSKSTSRPSPLATATSTASSISRAPISLFSDSEDDTDFLSASLNKEKEREKAEEVSASKSTTTKTTTLAARNLKKSIFDDDSDSDDLFK